MFLKCLVPLTLLWVGVATGTLVYESCAKPGLSCDGCNTLKLCHDLAPGMSIHDEMECEAGWTCENNECVNKINTLCHPSILEYTFRCHHKGVFPHPYDCKKYYICTTDDDSVVIRDGQEEKCENDYIFNPLSTFCSIKLADGECKMPVEKPCTQLGDHGAIKGNPHLYYVCLPRPGGTGVTDLVADIFRCNNGNRYTGNPLNKCHDPLMDLDVDGKCTGDGKFYVSGKCNAFKKCETGYTPVNEWCSSTQKFNSYTKECEEYGC